MVEHTYTFRPTKKERRLLPKIMGIVVVVVLLALAVNRGLAWFSPAYDGGEVEASVVTNLDQARALVQQEKFDEAHALLQPILEKATDPVVAPQAMLIQAEIFERTNKAPEALALLARASTDYAASPEYPAVAAQYARMLDKAGKRDEAKQVYEQLNDSAPPSFRAAALVGMARQAEQEKQLIQARELYAKAVKDAEFSSDPWNEAVDALGRLNVAAIFSKEETADSKYYVVAKGDTLNKIGVKLNTTQGLLTRANGIVEDAKLDLGQKLKYTPKDFRILVERSTCTLYLLDNQGLFKRYRVGLGMPGYETALGKYTIGNKQKDPVWHKPGFGPIPANDPVNELGTRWMPLVPAEAKALPTDLGIHGTIAPDTIGLYKSHGCPRLLNADVEELYDLIVRSTPVEIVETVDPAQLG
jgi:lipoprotein-anchoring transpeptidase ErfK/SrfK/predicted negative regulator of RcsB-dependent stress response